MGGEGGEEIWEVTFLVKDPQMTDPLLRPSILPLWGHITYYFIKYMFWKDGFGSLKKAWNNQEKGDYLFILYFIFKITPSYCDQITKYEQESYNVKIFVL